MMSTADDLRRRARAALEALFAVSEHAAEEAIEQAGLPSVFHWTTLPIRKAGALCVACRIRLLEAEVTP